MTVPMTVPMTVLVKWRRADQNARTKKLENKGRGKWPDYVRIVLLW